MPAQAHPWLHCGIEHTYHNAIIAHVHSYMYGSHAVSNGNMQMCALDFTLCTPVLYVAAGLSQNSYMPCHRFKSNKQVAINKFVMVTF